jgi:hypothetical protein
MFSGSTISVNKNYQAYPFASERGRENSLRAMIVRLHLGVPQQLDAFFSANTGMLQAARFEPAMGRSRQR